MTEERRRHWNRVFRANAPDRVSWFQPDPTLSLRQLESAGLSPSS
jgi:hypothetical protein